MTLAVENLSKRFNREWIFRKFTHTFQSGSTYAITGPNGSGKSTLLQILWGQLPPTSGTILYTQNSQPILAESIFRHISIATPYMDLIDEFTLEEHLGFHFKMKQINGNMSIDEMLDRMKLSHARKKYISNFSSGMKQRVKLALAFFTQADMIFLDEPGTNLDKPSFEWYQQQLAQLSAKIIFIASNNIDEYPSNASIINIMNYK